MTSTTAISDFLNWLNESEKEYFIPWGYEKLPDVSGGDLDICVHPMDFYNVSQWLLNRKYNATVCPRHSDSHRHVYYAGECTIDMFTSFCFAYEGKTVVLDIDPNYFYSSGRRILQNGFHIASPTVEALFTSLRIIGGRKDCVKRLEKYLLY